MLALIDDVGESHVRFIEQAISHESEPDLKLIRFFEAGFAFVTENLDQAKCMITTLYGTDEEFRQRLYMVYQPLFTLVESEIISSGVREGIFRRVDPVGTAALLLTVYLGTASQLSPDGTTLLDPRAVSDFARYALLKH